MIKREDLTCIACRWFYFMSGDGGYSEYTPGWDVEIRCGKKIWELDIYDDTRADFRTKLQTAKTCELFEPYKDEVED